MVCLLALGCSSSSEFAVDKKPPKKDVTKKDAFKQSSNRQSVDVDGGGGGVLFGSKTQAPSKNDPGDAFKSGPNKKVTSSKGSEFQIQKTPNAATKKQKDAFSAKPTTSKGVNLNTEQNSFSVKSRDKQPGQLNDAFATKVNDKQPGYQGDAFSTKVKTRKPERLEDAFAVKVKDNKQKSLDHAFSEKSKGRTG